MTSSNMDSVLYKMFEKLPSHAVFTQGLPCEQKIKRYVSCALTMGLKIVYYEHINQEGEITVDSF